MRAPVLFIAFLLLAFSCVKKTSMSIVPSIGIVDFKCMKKANGSDSGYIVISYQDGDGDIFRNKGNSVPNLVITTYHKDPSSGDFVSDYVEPEPGIKIPLSYATTVYQPGDGYAGKPVSGQIMVPYNEFRTGNDVKTIYSSAYAMDEAGHKSNVAFSQTITLNF
jgi:hypothetical protein